MVDPPQPSRPRSPRPAPPSGEERPPPARAVAPVAYREHLEREHGLTVVPEGGWPTDVKRYFLVRGQNGTQRRLAEYRGTLPEATAHFYYLLHPEQRPRR